MREIIDFWAQGNLFPAIMGILNRRLPQQLGICCRSEAADLGCYFNKRYF